MAASRPHLAQSAPQETVSQERYTESSDFESSKAESGRANDIKYGPPPTAEQDVHIGTTWLSHVASEAFRSSHENGHDTPVDSKPIVSADNALKPLAFETVPATMPISLSSLVQIQTLAPGSVRSSGSAHLSVLPDASGLTLSDGSTLLLKDGEAADIKLPDNPALRISRSGTLFLVQTTRTADATPRLTGPPYPSRTTGQSASGDVGFLRTTSGASSEEVATVRSATTALAAGESEGAASVCSLDVRTLVISTLLALVRFLLIV